MARPQGVVAPPPPAREAVAAAPPSARETVALPTPAREIVATPPPASQTVVAVPPPARETAPATTVYQDNWFDKLAIGYLSRNLQEASGTCCALPHIHAFE
jgi:hypothetical protein